MEWCVIFTTPMPFLVFKCFTRKTKMEKTFTRYLDAWRYMRDNNITGSVKSVGWNSFIVVKEASSTSRPADVQ